MKQDHRNGDGQRAAGVADPTVLARKAGGTPPPAGGGRRRTEPVEVRGLGW